MQSYFYALADFIKGRLTRDENFTCWLSAEDSDFVRFNRGLIRQPGHIKQIYLSVELIEHSRHANCSLALSGRLDQDERLISHTVGYLRHLLADLPDDPYFLTPSDSVSSEYIGLYHQTDREYLVDDIMKAANSFDFVGILASGPIYRGFANSHGQRNWHQTGSFNLDWSLFYQGDKAVKTTYAGFEWNSSEFKRKFDNAAAQLDSLRREPVTLKLGDYRAFLAPAALGEIISLLNWGGFSEKSLRTKQSPLRLMRDEQFRLNAAFSLSEHTAGGIAPSFQKEGFMKPDCVGLIDSGQLAGSLVSPRSAKEFDMQCNGANSNEMPVSIDVKPGELPISNVLQALGTGIYIGNLWYLNFSNRTQGRFTGMTRFATFWVEEGEIRAPLNVMRFDDSVLNLLGNNLAALTAERELLIDSESYGQRSTSSMLLPGALVESLRFVL